MAKILLKKPSNVTEMVELRTFADKARTTQMKMLQEQIEESKKR